MRLGKRVNHDKALGLFVVAASMSTGYFFTFLRYATIDCAGYNVPNGGACAVDVIASVFLALLSGSGFLGVYYFGPWVVNQKRDANGTEIDYVNSAKHFLNLTHLAPEPLDYFDYGFHANASYDEAHHQEININGKRVPTKVWGNSSIGSYEFHMGELPVSPGTSMASKIIRSLTGRAYTCNGYIRIDKYYTEIDPENPAANWAHAQTLSLDLVDYLVKNNKDGGCFFASNTATSHRALIAFRAGCNAVDVIIPVCPYFPGDSQIKNIGYVSLTKRESVVEAALTKSEPVVEAALSKKEPLEERAYISWAALCQSSGNIGQVCQCWQQHGVTPYSACQKASCAQCNANPFTSYCLDNFQPLC